MSVHFSEMYAVWDKTSVCSVCSIKNLTVDHQIRNKQKFLSHCNEGLLSFNTDIA